MDIVHHSDDSFSRRKALRLLGTGVLLVAPFAALVRPAYAERGPVASARVAAATPATPPPTPATPAPTPATPPPAKPPSRLATLGDTPLYADSAATLPLGIAPAGAIFEPPTATTGQLVQVRDAYSGGLSFVDRSRLNPVTAPATLAVPGRWWGRVTVDGANLRSAPHAQAPIVGHLPAGSPLVVSAWVVGDQLALDNPAWARLNDYTFIYSAGFRPVDLPSAPPLPADAPTTRPLDRHQPHAAGPGGV